MGMLGRVIGAVAGRAAARQIGGIGAGPIGMVAGTILPFVLRRFGPAGMIGVALGGYAIKKIAEGEAKRQAAEAVPPANPPASSTVQR